MKKIEITENAKFFLEQQNSKFFELSTPAKGCNGFKYDLKPIDDISNDYDVEQFENFSIAIPKKNLMFLLGTQIDLEDNRFERKLVFKNPLATSMCGCGESFGI